MRDILELCVELDKEAERLYQSIASSTPSPELRSLFGLLADEERTHVSWWSELIEAWDRGLLPDILDDPASVRARLEAIRAEMRSVEATPPDPGEADAVLAAAARVEFFMMDPVFGELIDLTEPARAQSRHEAYSSHIERLISAIAVHAPEGSLASILAAVLRRTWADNRMLIRYATKDPLTDLRNRRTLDTHLPQWAAWAARYGRPICVVLLDLDGLKHINDAYGHRTGDRALVVCANAIVSVIRGSDLAVRYGGDEFAIIAPETGPEDCRILSERLLAAMRARRVETGTHERVSLTCSVGSAVAHDPLGSVPRTADELIAAADESLHAAKQAGRGKAGEPVILEPR